MKPKYVRLVSDLHLEQYVGQRITFLSEQFIPPDPRDAESVLILAGDISSKISQLVDFIVSTQKRFMKVIYIPGNHEFYGYDLHDWHLNFTEAMSKLDDTEKTEFCTLGVGYLEFEDVRFIFATLWGDGGGTDKKHQDAVEQGLRDFYVIRKDGRKFRVPDMMELYKAQKAKIKELNDKPFRGHTIVATHHMPSHRLCHPRFGNAVNGGFAGYCDDILSADNAPQVWCFGHTHDTIDDMMWKTRVVCNPSGYYMEKNSAFNRYGPKFIDLSNLHEHSIG